MTGLESAIRASFEAKHGSEDEALLELILALLEEEELVMHQTYPRRIVKRLDALLEAYVEGA